MPGRRLSLTLGLLLLLSGCQLGYRAADGYVSLAQGYYQLSDSWSGRPQQLLQQVSWRSGNAQHVFLMTVLLNSDGYLVIALSPLGHELWRLHYGPGHRLSLSGIEPFNQPMFARRLLAEMQLSLLDASAIQDRLYRLSLQQHDEKRRLRSAENQPLLTITGAGKLATGQTVTIDADSYQLQIRTLQQDFL